jgi:hypothetical protein
MGDEQRLIARITTSAWTLDPWMPLAAQAPAMDRSRMIAAMDETGWYAASPIIWPVRAPSRSGPMARQASALPGPLERQAHRLLALLG